MTLRPLKLLSSMAAREVLGELIRGFSAQTGQSVAAEAAGGVEVAKRIQAGEDADVVVLADAAIDKLIAGGQLRAAGWTSRNPESPLRCAAAPGGLISAPKRRCRRRCWRQVR